MIICFLPAIAAAEVYQWTDSKGVVNYTSDPKNLPEVVRKNIDISAPSESKPLPSGKVKNSDEDAKKSINESVDKIAALSRQISDGIKYVDIYHEKDRPVSKYVLISYLNSMSYEINNLKDIAARSALSEDEKKRYLSQAADFRKKYSEFNKTVNDFDSLEVSNFKSDKQIDYKTSQTVYNNTSTTSRVVDPNTQVIYTVTEENFIFTFSANVSNTGSQADIAVELSGYNYQGKPVASHVMRTTVGSDIRKDIGDRIILARGIGQDITRWEISDVKIARNRK
jgi:hypothetical protein